MWKMFLFVFISSFLVYSQDNQTKAQITSYEVYIPANKLTKIIMCDSDSTNYFILFDSIIQQKQKVIFLVQPYYFNERCKYQDAIVIPFPNVNSGMYLIHYSNKDTSFVQKMIFLE